jgi:hypothetical protein
MDDGFSDAPEHKLHALVILTWQEPRVVIPRSYLEACKIWYANLSASHKLAADAAMKAFNMGDRETASAAIAVLPPVPRFP